MFRTRTEILLGENNIELLKAKHVLIIGVGGVGSYVCEMFARTGIENITIVDFDKVDVTNINRQLIALNSTIAQYKVDIMKNRILDINPHCEIKTLNIKCCKENFDIIFSNQFDYVIDAIDMINDKIDLIKYCHDNNIKCISAMGAGNRTGIPQYEAMDIFKTSHDGLAKIVRKKLREQDIKKHLVVSTKELSVSNDKAVIGSIAYHPAMCGLVIAANVINYFLKEKTDENNK